MAEDFSALAEEWRAVLSSGLVRHLYDGKPLGDETQRLLWRLGEVVAVISAIALYRGIDPGPIEHFYTLACQLAARTRRPSVKRIREASLMATHLVQRLRYICLSPALGISAPEADGRNVEVPAEPPVILGDPDEEVIVWGKRKPPLPHAQRKVVEVLTAAFAVGERLSKSQLDARTKADDGTEIDPLGALRRLRRDPDWKRAIDMAGKSHRGYTLRARPRTSTYKSAEKHTRPQTGG
jgi:hypothetical protein